MIYLFEIFGDNDSITEFHFSCWEEALFRLRVVYGARYCPETCKDKPYYINEDGSEAFVRITPLWLN